MTLPPTTTLAPVDGRLRAVLMRAGTSRGLFLHLSDLPSDRSQWPPILFSALGSPDGLYRKQLNGVGGGVSTQSKVAVCWKSDEDGIDVEYLFIQVPVDGGSLDFSGNCGNMASGVGPFAYDEGLVHGDDASCQVTIRNVNTGSIMRSTFHVDPVSHRHVNRLGTSTDIALSGVAGRGSPIQLEFLNPSGNMTGQLLPTGAAVDVVIVNNQNFRVSCVDAGNPFIFVPAEQFGLSLYEPLAMLAGDDELTTTLLTIRARMAVRMGLAASEDEARRRGGTPKVALIAAPVVKRRHGTRRKTIGRSRSLSSSSDSLSTSSHSVTADSTTDPSSVDESGDDDDDGLATAAPDILVRAWSMGAPHPTIQMTGAVCVATACATEGTLLSQMMRRQQHEPNRDAKAGDDGGDNKQRSVIITIGHASGTIKTACEIDEQADDPAKRFKSASVYRTARRLMEGCVFYD